MNRFTIAGLLSLSLCLAALAFGQDRALTIRAADVELRKAEIDFLADAGCRLTVYVAVNPPSVEPVYSRASYAFNGARCTQARTAALRAASLDLEVGDGTQP